MAATFETPSLVKFFDPYGKDAPYLRRGDQVKDSETEDNIPVKLVSLKGKLLFQIEYYHDPNPEKPDAYKLFRKSMSRLNGKEQQRFKTLITDSVTSMELAARMEQKYLINPDTAQPMQWWAGATDRLEEMLINRYAGLDMNVVTITHISEEKVTVIGNVRKATGKTEMHDVLVRGLSAPGRLSRARGLPMAYSEVWRLYLEINDKNKPEWYVQTQGDGTWLAHSQIGAPDGCRPDYGDVWKE